MAEKTIIQIEIDWAEEQDLTMIGHEEIEAGLNESLENMFISGDAYPDYWQVKTIQKGNRGDDRS